MHPRTILLWATFAGICHAQDWQPLFNGRDLEGWSGDPRLWKVENGTIVGETDDAERKTKANTFLIREGMEPDDFTLEFKARVTGKNNSGVQYRSKRPDPKGWVLKGYQCDLHPAKEYLGMLYEEGGRGIACKRGEIVELNDKPKPIGKLEIPEVKLEEWNTFRIEARGNILKHFVNDKLAAEIHDIHPEKRSLKGFIGLQLHAGPPMKAEYKDIRWKKAEVGAEVKPAAPAPETGKASGGVEDMTAKYKLQPGFKLERVYQVPKEQGSWVSMTVREDGVFYCADQTGGIFRVAPGAGGALVVEPARFSLKGAHGLLWHKGILWVSVNESRDGGVWKVTDSDNDGEPDKAERVKETKGSGEHGPHSLVLSPDGKWIYFVCGNHTNLPEFDSSVVPKVWQEDQLLTRRPDARGHATGRMAPGGWIARFTPDTNHWELFSAGYRNSYDMAFNEHGDAFTYDADMEWDLGMPWYRPTRICHVTAGSEYGWRYGTGKWPAEYEDSMPSQLDIGPGSPTGMLSGSGAKFPQKYQKALFAFDWTFATIYSIHLTPDGDGYRAESEEFLAGSGLPLTDGEIGADGAMYFLTGGRRSGSAMWRISYTGNEKTDPVAYQTKERAPRNITAAASDIGSPNRVTRHQARVALELQGADAVKRVLDSANQPWHIITAAIGLARVGTAEHVATILTALEKLDWNSLDTAQRVNWLRAAGLVFARHGKPDAAARAKVIFKIDAAFPSKNELLDRELCRMLSYLEAPGVVSRTLDLMDASGPGTPPDWLELAKRNSGYGKTVEAMIANLPPTQVIHYIYCLREVKGPWKEEERRRFFAWFPNLLNRKGGASYGGFILDLRTQTLANAAPDERKFLDELIQSSPPPNVLANLPRPKGPGRTWTIDDVEKIAAAGFTKANRENGKTMYQAALCSTCHRFGGEGGAAGPDLSTVAGRFTARDLAESILEPGKVVSDQYQFTQITRTDGSTIIGKIVEENDKETIIAISPFDMTQKTKIPTNSIREKKPSPASPMPAGLIHSLNEEELRDLLAYLLGSQP